MPSPTFDGNKLFDSINHDGDNFSEGILYPLDYTKIIQDIHFDGENGDYILTHGWPDRKWEFVGLISAPTGEAFGGIIRAIQSAIDDADSDDSSYHDLKDSFGGDYPKAQVRSMSYLQKPHFTAGGGYVAQIRVEGVIQGMDQDGNSGDSGS
jgi:hypothetical protein